MPNVLNLKVRTFGEPRRFLGVFPSSSQVFAPEDCWAEVAAVHCRVEALLVSCIKCHMEDG